MPSRSLILNGLVIKFMSEYNYSTVKDCGCGIYHENEVKELRYVRLQRFSKNISGSPKMNVRVALKKYLEKGNAPWC